MNCFLRTFVFLLDVFMHISPSLVPTSTTTSMGFSGAVTLNFSGTCNSGDIEWKHRGKTASGVLRPPRLFAQLDQATGLFKPGPSAENRVKHVDGTLCLTITFVVFNDNGWFEVYCNGKDVQDLELKVLVPTKIFAHVGENKVLLFYGSTDSVTKDTEIYIRWTKDGRNVVNVTAGNVIYGPGFEGKMNVSTKGYRHGDFSLTVVNVHSSDQGIYQCFYGPDNQQGNPEAFHLSVSPKVDEKQESGTCLPWKIGVAVLVIVVFSVFGFKVYNWRPECFQTQMVSHPVQESPAELVIKPNHKNEESDLISGSELGSDVEEDKTRNGTCVPFAPALIT